MSPSFSLLSRAHVAYELKTWTRARAPNPVTFGQKLNGIEGKFTEHYFKQILDLLRARAQGVRVRKIYYRFSVFIIIW